MTKLRMIVFGIRTFIIIAFIFSFFIFDADIVDGTSMMPTIHDGDVVISTKNHDFVKTGDIIQFHLDDGYYIKRVVAHSGDFVEIEDGILRVNGLISDYNEYGIKASDNIHVLLESNEYFVLGDNRDISFDSRSFGPITDDIISGVVIFHINRVILNIFCIFIIVSIILEEIIYRRSRKDDADKCSIYE